MMWLRRLAAVAVLAAPLALVSCSNTAAVKFVEDTANEICACKDMSCAQGVLDKMTKRLDEFKDAKGTEGDKQKIEAAQKKMQDCLTKLQSAPAPAK